MRQKTDCPSLDQLAMLTSFTKGGAQMADTPPQQI